MKKLLVLFIIAGFFTALVSCSDSKNEEEDDDFYNTPDNNQTGDETTDEEEQSNDPDEEDVTTVPDEDDVTPVPDEDEIVPVPDEDDITPVPDEDTELDADETGDDDEIDDSDNKPVPVECGEGEVGLTIKSFYKDGMDDVDGGGVVNRDPAGTATTDPDAACYDIDTVVTLTVVPDAGFDFLEWKGKNAGKVTGDFPTYSVTLDTFVTLRAQFAPEQ